MKFPWVSRLALELAMQARDDARSDLAKEQARTKDLTDTILRMKETGAVVLPSGSELRLKHRDPSEFEVVVDRNKRAQNDPRLRTHLLDWAAREMRRPLGERETEEDRKEMVLMRLEGWSNVNHNDLDDDDMDEIDRTLAHAGGR